MSCGGADNPAEPGPVNVPMPVPFSLVVSGSSNRENTSPKKSPELLVRESAAYTAPQKGSDFNALARSLFTRILFRRSLAGIDSDSIRMQLLGNRNHRFGNTACRVGPAELFDAIF